MKVRENESCIKRGWGEKVKKIPTEESMRRERSWDIQKRVEWLKIKVDGTQNRHEMLKKKQQRR